MALPPRPKPKSYSLNDIAFGILPNLGGARIEIKVSKHQNYKYVDIRYNDSQIRFAFETSVFIAVNVITDQAETPRGTGPLGMPGPRHVLWSN